MSVAAGSRRAESLHRAIDGLNPSYFAMVMATGIVSIAARLQGYATLAGLLSWLNVAFYAVLSLLTAARLALAGSRVLADLSDHKRGVGFFTSVAGTCVLGSQCVIVLDAPRVALALWGVGAALWLVLFYTVLTLLTVKRAKPTLGEGLHGGWLLLVVATQSLAVLGNLVVPCLGDYNESSLFFCLVMWLAGGMLYIWIIALIFYRYTFFTMEPGDLTPPYWINMGAMAISTLAGAGLVINGPRSQLLEDLLPFLKGLTLLFWATATLWIPMLVILGVWRHVYRRFPLTYDPSYWGAVFPLGMYSVCTQRMAGALGLPFLLVVPRFAVFIALAAWLATAFGLVLALARPPFSAPRSPLKP